jgi:hypothetical protein
LRKIAQQTADAPNIVDGAVLTVNIAGRTAYFEADGLAAASGGKLHVAEMKSFPITDGRCDGDKLGAACDQAAWYLLLCRRQLVELGLSPEAVSDNGFIIVASGLGLAPTLLVQDLSKRVRRADRLLAAAADGDDVLALASGLRFPAEDTAAQARIDTLEAMMDQVGTQYRPECLSDCGMSRLCRGRAQDAGLANLCGSAVVRFLPGVRTLDRASELAGGAQAIAEERHAGQALARAGAIYDRVMKQAAL